MSDAYRDGEAPLRAQLDELVARRDELEQALAATKRDLAAAERRLGRGASHRRAGLWWSALPVGVVCLSGWAFCCSGFRCCYPRSQSAKVGAETVRQAADLYMSTENDRVCPILERLVAKKKLDAKKVQDPWGRPYLVECTADDVRVTSAGKDGFFFTADDIRDDLTPAEMKRAAELNS